jgi:ribosomal-protein-alanine acetyltransferase
MSIAIRPAGANEAAVFAALHGEHFTPAWDAQSFRELMEQDGALALLAVADDEPIGFILGRVVVDEAEILTIGVSQSWQRKGVATMLVNQLARYAIEKGARRIFLEVATDNEAARRLYLSLDFHEVGRRPAYYERPGEARVDAIIMSKEGTLSTSGGRAARGSV